MKNPKQQLILSTMSAHVLAALALMSGAAHAQTVAPSVEDVPVSNTALDS